ncbi:hypothetical protein [Streptomyces sp. PU-14G]|uniref:hypothetical protein n=1 Tax=Streptomyces sp. PU-14G TaxID=2800808 RepID=UPI0034DE8BD0
MSRAKDEFGIVAVPAGAWCDSVTGMCSVDAADAADAVDGVNAVDAVDGADAASAVEASDENAAGGVPGAAQGGSTARLSPPTR